VVSGEWWSLFAALLGFSQVCNVAIDPADQVIGFLFELRGQGLIAISFILAGIKVIDQLIHRTAGQTAEVNVFLIVPAAVPFGNVVGYGNRSPPHLVAKSVLFLSWKLLKEKISPFPECPSDVVQLKIIKFETPFFHKSSPPP
jgi:hypothetical protein